MLSWLIPEAHAQAQTSQADGLIQVGMIVFMLVVFYFVLIRPQQKRQKEHKNMLDAVEVGDEVSTHAGLLGKVRKIEDAYIVLKVADNVELRFQKSAIAAILPKGTLKSIG
jgi:preprotein translocase subunit YajC